MRNQKSTGRKSGATPAGKTCSNPKCKRFKVYASFNRDKGVPDGYARECRVCRLRTQRRSKANYLRKVDKLKSKKVCAKCGESRTYMLDFHHNKPSEKVASISDLRDRRASIEKIKEEIAKCTVLCSNCHRELHYKKITITQYLKEDTTCT